jgi:hypothetical protein
LFITDVSAELAQLARIASIPCVPVLQHGDRNDPGHMAAYESAVGILAPYAAELEQPGRPPWMRDMIFHAGGLGVAPEALDNAAERKALGIDPDADLSPLWKDVFLFHWKEESQHAIIDELEWKREDAKLTAEARDAAVNDLIALAGAVDTMLQAQAGEDARYFGEVCGRALEPAERAQIERTMLAAYRWQYILSGAQEPRFRDLLVGLITPAQHERIGAALAPIAA